MKKLILVSCCLILLFKLTCSMELYSLAESSSNDQIEKNLYNRMVCENEKLQINCNRPDHVIKIERAYYGRYSITPCNKNHLKFVKSCTANNSMQIIKNLCENKPSCNEKITTNLFKFDPCPGIEKVLEVNYKCEPVNHNLKQYFYLNKGKSMFEADDLIIQTTETTQSTIGQVTNAIVKCKSKFVHKTYNYEIVVEIGKLVKMPCSFENDLFSEREDEPVVGTHLYKCDIDGRFRLVNTTCSFKNKNWIENLNLEFEYKKDAFKILEKINSDLKNGSLIEETYSISSIIDFLSNVTNSVIDNKSNISNSFINSVDSILSNTNNWKGLDYSEKSRSITKLVDLVDKVFFEKNINTESEFLIANENLVAELSLNKELKNELMFGLTSTEKVYLNIEKPVYKNINELFYSKNITDFILNSNIISFKTNDNRLINEIKTNPIEIVFKNLISMNSEQTPVCAYWKYDKYSYEGRWCTDGCYLKHSNQTHTTCHCNHMTHFSILIDLFDTHKSISKVHTQILTFLTIALSSVSCISIVLTLLAFKFIKIIKKNRQQSSTKDLTTITTHLCVCLLISLIIFLFGIVANELRLSTLCSFIALVSHYFFLCAFFWMLLEGVQLYLMLVRIFILEVSPIRKFYLLAYGIPFFIVFVSKLFDHFVLDSNGYGTNTHCWLSSYKNFNLSFIIPISFILFFNLIMLGLVIFSMKNLNKNKISRNLNKKQDDFFRSLFGFWSLIVTLLGLPWVLGYFILDSKKTLIFSYLFTILNSSQGTILFLFHCVLSKSVRTEIFKSLFDTSKSKSTSTSSNYKKNRSRPIITINELDDDEDLMPKLNRSIYYQRPILSRDNSKKNVRMLSSIPYMKRASSFLSSSSVNSNNPTQSTYITPINLHRYSSNLTSYNNTTSVPLQPPPPPPPLNLNNINNNNNSNRFSTFKSNSQTKKFSNYDENQYLTPEYHSYTGIDDNDTNYIDDDLDNEENYVEVGDEFLEPSLSCLNQKSKSLKSKLKSLIATPEDFDQSTTSSSTSCSSNKSTQSSSVNSYDNLKAKKYLCGVNSKL